VNRVLVRAVCVALLAPSAASALARAQSSDALRTAADSTLEARTSAVASQLRCPVCQGLSLQDSPAELAQSMRSVVRDQLASGRTPDEVKAYFVSRYGEWILLAPTPHGFNLLAYAIPIIVVVAGGGVIVLAVRRWTATGTITPPESCSAAADDRP